MNNKELLKLSGKALGAGLIVGIITYELLDLIFDLRNNLLAVLKSKKITRDED